MGKLNYNRPCFRKGKEANMDIGNKPLQQRIYLKVRYQEKEHVKSMGARWDDANKLWYIYPCNPFIDYFIDYIGNKPVTLTELPPEPPVKKSKNTDKPKTDLKELLRKLNEGKNKH